MSSVICIYPYPWASNPRLKVKDPYLFPESLARLLNYNQSIFVKGPCGQLMEWDDSSQLTNWLGVLVNILTITVCLIFCRHRFSKNSIFVFFHINMATVICSKIISHLFSGSPQIIKCDLTVGELENRPIKRFMRVLLPHILIAESSASINYLRGLLGNQARIYKVLNGVQIYHNSVNDMVSKRNYRVSHKSENILICTRLSVQKKSPQKHIDFAEIILRKGLNVVFIDYGPTTEYWHKLLSLLQQYPDQLILKQAVNHLELIELMLNSRVYVSLSSSESSKIILAEALTMGLFLVSTPVGMALDLKELFPERVEIIPFNLSLESTSTRICKLMRYDSFPIDLTLLNWEASISRSGLLGELKRVNEATIE